MNLQEIITAYDFTGKTVAITGGGGVLCSEMAKCLAGCNAHVVVLDRDMALGEKVIQSLQGTKGKHKAIFIDVLDKGKVLPNTGRSIFSLMVPEEIIQRRQQVLKCHSSIFQQKRYSSFPI